MRLFLFFIVFLSVYLQANGDRILVYLGKDIVLQSELEFNKNELEKSGTSQTECQIFEGILLNKLMVQQAAIDSITVSDAEVKARIERSISMMMSQVGGRENFEQNIGKKPAEVRQYLYEPIKENLLVERMRDQIVKNVKVTPQDVYDFYKKQEFDLPMIPEQVLLSQLIIQPEISPEIQKKMLDELNKIREEVVSGNLTMGLAAAMYSEDPGSQARGGIIGLMPRYQLVSEFSSIAFRLQPGEISKVFKTRYGYHFLQVVERRGDMINVAHVLKKPKPELSDIQTAQALADSIYQEIMVGNIEFSEAVARYSTDKNTKYSGGVIHNLESHNNMFVVNQIFQEARNNPAYAYLRDIVFSLTGAEEGSITYPSLVTDMEQTKVIQIAKLEKRIPPHTANLEYDYVMIEKMTKNYLEQEEIKRWANRIIQNNYVKMDAQYQTCDFVYHWEK